MKNTASIVVISLSLTFTLAAQTRATAEAPDVLLERAIQKQTVDGDLKAAIEIYKKILERTGRNRAVEAKALLRLGHCQERLGQTEAVKAYERLTRDYADQPTEANAARARLAAMRETKSGEVSFHRVFESSPDFNGNAVSSNGRYLLTTQDLKGNVLAQIHDLVTGEVRKLPCSCRYPANPALSPDGAEFVYQPLYDQAPQPSRRPENQVRIARTDGSGDRLLYDAQEFAYVYPYGFSPDGKQFLIGRRHKDGSADFAVLSLAGGSIRTVKTTGHAEYRRGVAFSPDGKYIAYDALPIPNTSNEDIHIVSIDNGNITVLTDDLGDESVLGWAPDGSGILTRTDNAGTQDAYFQPMRGAQPSGPRRLVKRNIGRTSAINLGFTRNGRLFYRTRGENIGFYLGRLDESGRLDSKLTPSQGLYGSGAQLPAWSPDGAKLAFWARWPDIGLPTVGIRTLASGAVSTLPSTVFVNFIEWPADSSSIVVGGWEKGNRPVIALLDTRNGQSTVVKQTDDLSMRYRPQASPDGKQLYFWEWRVQPPEPGRIARLDLTSREERTVFEPGGPFSVSPDGRSLAIVHSGVLKVVALSDRSVREIAREVGEPLAWLPNSGSILFQKNGREIWRVPAEGGTPIQVGVFEDWVSRLKFHPDGRQIAISTAKITVEVWVADNLLSAAKAGSR